MSLRFIDGFDHYVTADLTEKWTSLVASPAISAAAGRRSGGALLSPNAVTTATSVTKTLDAQGTWIVGFAFKFNQVPVAAACLCTLLDAGTVQASLRMNVDGTLSAMRGNSGGTVLGTSAFALVVNVFYYIEMKIVISDTVGTFEIKVDGSSKLALTSQDTKSSANATANQVRIGNDGGVGAGSTYTFDDLYICDGAGSTNNSFLGDCRVDAYLPSGNGNSSGMTGSDGNSTDNHLLVDDAAPDDDTTYVEHATVATKDDYAFSNMSHAPSSIFGVQVLANAKKDDAGLRSLTTVTRSDGTDYDGASQTLSTSYIYYRDIHEVDPATSAAWLKAAVNAANFGIKVAA